MTDIIITAAIVAATAGAVGACLRWAVRPVIGAYRLGRELERLTIRSRARRGPGATTRGQQ